jgi:hypothetical protein
LVFKEKAFKRRKLGELQTKLDRVKNIVVTLKTNKSTRASYSSKLRINKESSAMRLK